MASVAAALAKALLSSVKVFLFVKLLFFWGRKRLLFHKLLINKAR